MSERDRARFYDWVCEQTDRGTAEFVMSRLAPAPLDELVTKEYLSAEFSSFALTVAAEFKAVRQEMAAEFKAVRSEMADEFKAVREESARRYRVLFTMTIALSALVISTVLGVAAIA